jgi:phage terminase large subunit-like protein
LLKLKEIKLERARQNLIRNIYPETGPLSRFAYPKHMSFFASQARERLFMAANRVGKSFGVGGYEVSLHLTGNYPDWWQGRRYDRPVDVWAAGTTAQTTRDIIQKILIGDYHERGTGLIPASSIHTAVRKAGIPEGIELCRIRHKSGGLSNIGFKAYEQGRKSFEGTAKDVIWADEEPPMDIYSEMLMRTMTTKGQVLLTFTPLSGMSEVVLSFFTDDLEPKKAESKFVVMAGWDDAPHLTAEAKAELLASIPKYQRDARTKGIPRPSTGLIYPIDDVDLMIPDFQLPEFFPRMYALDVGWNKTATLWGAHDQTNDIVYIYGEYYRSEAEPSVHADAIKKRGNLLGVIDPAARGRSQYDGKRLIDAYTDQGLRLEPAKNAVEAGIYEVWKRLTTGRLKIFKSCQNALTEIKLYRRDENGKIVKEKDHLMDCLRYLVMDITRAEYNPPPIERPDMAQVYQHQDSLAWMA